MGIHNRIWNFITHQRNQNLYNYFSRGWKGIGFPFRTPIKVSIFTSNIGIVCLWPDVRKQEWSHFRILPVLYIEGSPDTRQAVRVILRSRCTSHECGITKISLCREILIGIEINTDISCGNQVWVFHNGAIIIACLTLESSKILLIILQLFKKRKNIWT